jgi:cysteine synthase B
VGGGFERYAKAEYENPTGSVKDRAAAAIVAGAWARGELGAGGVLVDASSGNTAVAYAALGQEFGFGVELYVPRNANPERLHRLRALGARVIPTDPLNGTDEAQRVARARAESDPSRCFYADQYNNMDNPGAHDRSTGPEIGQQSGGRVTVLVAGVGIGGTISGCAQFLRERRPDARIVGVQPARPVQGLEGLKHLPTALRPGPYEARLVDETVSVETEDAQAQQQDLQDREGLRVGISSGAAVWAALRVGRVRPGSVIVTLLPDRAPATREEDPR